MFNHVGEEFIKQHYHHELSMTNIEKLHNGYLEKLNNDKIYLHGDGNKMIKS